jgi:hypothetical protein
VEQPCSSSRRSDGQFAAIASTVWSVTPLHLPPGRAGEPWVRPGLPSLPVGTARGVSYAAAALSRGR